tara:strand:+ start:371 stop:904 length:534 start_codon:yes stop_codon:yes gene_type:complete
MSANGSPQYNISKKIEDCLLFLESASLFLSELKEAFLPYGPKILRNIRSHCRDISTRLTGWDLFWGLISLLVLASFITMVVSGFCILGYQTFSWLQSGIWEEIPIALTFNYFLEGTTIHNWVSEPNSWLGLHRIVSWSLENIPLSFILITNGTFLTLFWAGIAIMAVCYRYYKLKKN